MAFPLNQKTEVVEFFPPLLLSSVTMGQALLASTISELCLTNSFLLQEAARGYALGFSCSFPLACKSDFTSFSAAGCVCPVSGPWKHCTAPLHVQVHGGTVPWALVLSWVDVFRTLKAVTLWKSSSNSAVGWEM